MGGEKCSDDVQRKTLRAVMYAAARSTAAGKRRVRAQVGWVAIFGSVSMFIAQPCAGPSFPGATQRLHFASPYATFWGVRKSVRKRSSRVQQPSATSRPPSGRVFIVAGRWKGRMGYYDDDADGRVLHCDPDDVKGYVLVRPSSIVE